MKSIIFGLALIVAVSCDVSHLQGQGWSKDENGYNYPKPGAKFEDVPEPIPEEPLPEEPAVPEYQVVEEVAVSAGCVNGGSGPYCCFNGADNEDCYIPSDEPVYEEVIVEEPVVAELPVAEAPVVALDEPTNDYLPPLNNEYLPPVLRKRAVQAKRQVPARRVVQVKRQVPARRVVQVKQAKRQAPVRRVVQVKRQVPAKNYRVVRRQ